jgi:hypothetical protein
MASCGQPKAAQHHPRRPDGRGLRAGVLLHPRAGIRGPDQGPARHDRGRALVEAPCATISTTGWPPDTKAPGAILDFLVLRAEERLRRRQEKETARKSATKKLRLPGKLVDCSQQARDGTELFIVEGDSAGGSAKMARDRKTQALLPLRGKILNVLGAASSKARPERRDLRPLPGARRGHGHEVQHRRPALRQGHHHDRRRRRRRAYRLAADDVLLHPDAAPDRQGAPLPRLPAALPADPGRDARLRHRRVRADRA